MTSFKLIAIRPLENCNEIYHKNLKKNVVYQFYNNYTFQYRDSNNKGEVTQIFYKETFSDSIYKIKNASVNISAIVGKNGSGKSSLFELFFVAIYNLAIETGILTFIVNKYGDREYLEMKEGVAVEIYYELEQTIYCLKFSERNNMAFKINKFINKNSDGKFFKSGLLSNGKVELKKHFFYSLATSYSFYSLNPETLGVWINALFHKSDAYQTPLVINPYRENGTVNIANEFYLTKQRLLSNILKPITNDNYNHRELTEYQTATSISFELNKNKILYAYKKGAVEVSFEDFFKINNREILFKYIYEIFSITINVDSKIKFKEQIENYIIKKIINIARTYSDYEEYFTDELIAHVGKPGDTKNLSVRYEMNFKNIKKFREYLKRLKEDGSHITFKLRQSFNYLRNDLLRNDNETSWKNHLIRNKETERFKISIESLSQRIQKVRRRNLAIIELIPPSIFDIEIYLTSKGETENPNTIFSRLSSGEQQLIQSVQGILYHINNINSVFNDPKDNKIKYRYINILLDEIELYFHPDYQRKFISFLLRGIESMNFNNIKGYNILFSTHSPFILSDIPVSNILKIREGAAMEYKPKEQTFGANVHDLLSNDFYLSEGFIGEFAKRKITEVIDFLNLKLLEREVEKLSPNDSDYISKTNEIGERVKTKVSIDKISCKKIIDLVGEPIINAKLNEMYNEIYYIEDEISLLEEKRQEIDEKINKLKSR